MVYAKNQEKKRWEKVSTSLICVVIASFVMALNVKSFVRAGNLFPGGFTGLTVLIQRICKTYYDYDISYTLVNVTLNAIPAYIGYKTIGKRFTVFSLMMVFLSGLIVDFLPDITITSDRLLIAVFGGIMNGTAISIALHGRASSGGTDFIAVFLSRFNIPSWNVVLGINACMLTLAGLLFGWEAALYSIILQFVSTQVINTVNQSYSRATVQIITSHPEAIQEQLLAFTHHGITRFEGVGCYSKEEKTMLLTVVGKDEVKEVVKFVLQIDSHAFINVMRSERVYGRFYQDPME